jgi:hypothetical protein
LDNSPWNFSAADAFAKRHNDWTAYTVQQRDQAAQAMNPATAPPPAGLMPGSQGYTAPPGAQVGKSFEDWLREYMDELNKGVNWNDPQVKALLGQAQGAASEDAKRRGIQGPMAVGNAQQAYVGAQAQLRAQNEQQRLNAIHLGLGNDQDKAQLQLQRDRFNYGIDQDNYQRKLDQWTLDNNNSAGTGQAIGSVIGGLAGTAASFIPGLQPFAPALIGGGATLGGTIGRGFGGSNSPPPPIYQGRTRI